MIILALCIVDLFYIFPNKQNFINVELQDTQYNLILSIIKILSTT